jgi:hypothetical protein
MKEKKAEIYTLFDEAVKNKKTEERESRLYRRLFFLVLTLLLAGIIAGLYIYTEQRKDFRGVVSDSLKRAERLEEERKFIAAKELYLSVGGITGFADEDIERAIKRLDERIGHTKEVLAYRDKIHIKNLRFWRDKYEIKVTGNIVNAGKRNLNDIELSVYCLDAYDKPVCEETIRTVSSDGKPLRRFQKRTFSFLTNYPKREFSVDIPVVEKSVKGVQIIVSDINFEDTD